MISAKVEEMYDEGTGLRGGMTEMGGGRTKLKMIIGGPL
jgi:hypothetical protein